MSAVDAVWRDLVFAARLLRRAPLFTVAVLLTIALGVGVNTAVFSVVNAIVLRPLPVPAGDRLIVVATQDTSSRTMSPVSFADLQDYRAASVRVFDDIAGYTVGFLGLAPEGGRPARVLVTTITGNYFELLGIRPALGRLIASGEGEPRRTDRIAVIGHATWRQRFNADPAIVGKRIRVNGQPLTVVGVAPEHFAGTFAFSESELYLPLNWAGGGDLDDRAGRGLHAIARLRAGVAIDDAQATMTVVGQRLAREYPDSNEGVTIRVVPERFARPEEDQYRTNALVAAIMLALVGLVMVVATVNVTNLLLARAAGRHRELAIRTSLGAGRGRLVRQMVTESLLLATLGGGAGLLAGTWAAGLLASTRLPGDLPVRFDFQLDARVLMYASAVTLVTGIAVGVLPALRAPGDDPVRALRQLPRNSSRHSRRAVSGLLVSAQAACCVVLLSAAALFVRSLWQAERVDLGFRPDGVLNVHMDVDQLGYSTEQGRALFDDVERRVRALTGVERASYAFTVPMGYIRVGTGIEAEGVVLGMRGPVATGRNIVSPEYFDTMGIPIVRGRSFRESDTERSGPVAIINQRLADALWPGADPIGRRIRYASAGAPWLEVVGVTPTGKYEFLFEEPQPYVYVPMAQEYAALRVLQVRTAAGASTLAPAIERAIREIEPNLPVYDVQTMRQALGSGLGFFPVRVGAAAAALFGALALALALVGLYGVVSYLANQRSHEIGVRMAVGATRHDIIGLVIRDGWRLVQLGLIAGTAASVMTNRMVERFLFGIRATDPLVLIGLPILFGGAALAACAIPAWRAARLDPTVALRSE